MTYPFQIKSTDDLLKILEEHNVEYVDFRFTDSKGKLQHTAQHISTIDKDILKDGIMFDGSSIAGWKDIDESDMILVPDIQTAYLDPFAAHATMNVFCDVVEPETQDNYDRDPRSICKKAEEHLRSTGIADTVFFGPEAEFFIFDDIRIHTEMNHVSYEFDSQEGPYNKGRRYENGNMGHRPAAKSGYFPVAPVDSGSDLRAEMVSVLKEIGLEVEKHHHEVAPSQHELGMKFDTMTRCADALQNYKYVVHNVAHVYGKTATFMPKPVFGDNGSGMHCHQSLWKDGKPMFAGKEYAGLSQECLWYIGGIIKHARALNAFTNPSTNSYKRLVPGYEAPVLLAYAERNRSASIRVPYGAGEKAKRIEVRFPDPSANPYLAFAAQLMAGLDGIKNKIDPGPAMNHNLYDLEAEELKSIPKVCSSLRQALQALENDQDFLLDGGVFSKEMIKGYIDLRLEELKAYETMPHPIEFAMYYSC